MTAALSHPSPEFSLKFNFAGHECPNGPAYYACLLPMSTNFTLEALFNHVNSAHRSILAPTFGCRAILQLSEPLRCWTDVPLHVKSPPQDRSFCKSLNSPVFMSDLDEDCRVVFAVVESKKRRPDVEEPSPLLFTRLIDGVFLTKGAKKLSYSSLFYRPGVRTLVFDNTRLVSYCEEQGDLTGSWRLAVNAPRALSYGHVLDLLHQFWGERSNDKHEQMFRQLEVQHLPRNSPMLVLHIESKLSNPYFQVALNTFIARYRSILPPSLGIIGVDWTYPLKTFEKILSFLSQTSERLLLTTAFEYDLFQMPNMHALEKHRDFFQQLSNIILEYPNVITKVFSMAPCHASNLLACVEELGLNDISSDLPIVSALALHKDVVWAMVRWCIDEKKEKFPDKSTRREVAVAQFNHLRDFAGGYRLSREGTAGSSPPFFSTSRTTRYLDSLYHWRPSAENFLESVLDDYKQYQILHSDYPASLMQRLQRIFKQSNPEDQKWLVLAINSPQHFIAHKPAFDMPLTPANLFTERKGSSPGGNVEIWQEVPGYTTAKIMEALGMLALRYHKKGDFITIEVRVAGSKLRTLLSNSLMSSVNHVNVIKPFHGIDTDPVAWTKEFLEGWHSAQPVRFSRNIRERDMQEIYSALIDFSHGTVSSKLVKNGSASLAPVEVHVVKNRQAINGDGRNGFIDLFTSSPSIPPSQASASISSHIKLFRSEAYVVETKNMPLEDTEQGTNGQLRGKKPTEGDLLKFQKALHDLDWDRFLKELPKEKKSVQDAIEREEKRFDFKRWEGDRDVPERCGRILAPPLRVEHIFYTVKINSTWCRRSFRWMALRARLQLLEYEGPILAGDSESSKKLKKAGYIQDERIGVDWANLEVKFGGQMVNLLAVHFVGGVVVCDRFKRLQSKFTYTTK